MVNVGDTVYERLQIGESKTNKAYKGTVIYVHPKKRFYRVEFNLPSGTVRECFIIEPKRESRRINERVH